jgi:hypothetical protein
VALDDHAELVADQNYVDAGAGGGVGAAIVVGGQAGKFFAILFHFLQGVDGDGFGLGFLNRHRLGQEVLR